MKRREFLKAGAGAAALSLVAPGQLFAGSTSGTIFESCQHLDVALDLLLEYLGDEGLKLRSLGKSSKKALHSYVGFCVSEERYQTDPTEPVVCAVEGYKTCTRDGWIISAMLGLVDRIKECKITECREPTLDELNIFDHPNPEHYVKTKDGVTLCLSVSHYDFKVFDELVPGRVLYYRLFDTEGEE